jgi:hypothetical protein
MGVTRAGQLMQGCRWVKQPAQSAAETWDLAGLLGFDVPRIFWLTSVPTDQWRGRHAHRKSILATFAPVGACSLTLDDGREKQTVELRSDGPGLIVGPWIWHDLHSFASNTVILVAASTVYDESEYVRDYETFLREVRARPRSPGP